MDRCFFMKTRVCSMLWLSSKIPCRGLQWKEGQENTRIAFLLLPLKEQSVMVHQSCSGWECHGGPKAGQTVPRWAAEFCSALFSWLLPPFENEKLTLNISPHNGKWIDTLGMTPWNEQRLENSFSGDPEEGERKTGHGSIPLTYRILLTDHRMTHTLKLTFNSCQDHLTTSPSF